MAVIEGAYRGYQTAGAPAVAVNEIQTLTFGGTPTGGTFTITFDGWTTAAITWVNVNATLVSNIDTALEALPNIGTGGVTTAVGTMTAGIGTITCTFAGTNTAGVAQPLMTNTNAMTGTSPTLVITETTAGVTASARGAPKGATLVDTTNGLAYINTGTALVPVWTKVGLQT